MARFDDPVDIAMTTAASQISRFAHRCGDVSLALAMHAAVPLELSPELVHLLRVNFVPGAEFISEADLLLSPLCEEIGGGRYAMEREVRDLLLDDLRAGRGGPERIRDVARFLLRYVERERNPANSLDMRAHLQVERWSALARLDPRQVAEELARALQASLDDEDTGEAVRITRLVDTLSAPLAVLHEFVHYAATLHRQLTTAPDTEPMGSAPFPEVPTTLEAAPPAGLRSERAGRRPAGTGAQRMRDQLLAELRERLGTFATDDDPAVLLGEDVRGLLAALAEAVGDPASNLGAAYTAGMAHWFRHVALGVGEDQEDLEAALAWLAPLYREHPDAVPDLARRYLEAGRPTTDAVSTPTAADRPRTVDGNVSISIDAEQATRILTQASQTGDVAAMTEGINLLHKVLGSVPADHPHRVAYSSNLVGALQARFERTGDLADLAEAAKIGRVAAEATPRGHPDRAALLNNLGNVLRTRFARTGSRADLNDAITFGRAAAEATPPGHASHGPCLANLAAALGTRFGLAGDRADLDEAITTARAAVDAIPQGDLDRATALANLAVSLRTRFTQTGSSTDLDEAITVGHAAAEATPPGHPNHGPFLSNLAAIVGTRFEQEGRQEDLDEIITVGRAAVEALPRGSPNRPAALTNLATALLARSARTGSRADLDEAITVGQSTVDATARGHPGRVGLLSNLGAALRTRSTRTGDQTDLDQAVTLGRAAVEATPYGHPDRAAPLTNLAAALQARFERAGNQADLDEAVTAGRAAVEATPGGHTNRPIRLSNLGAVLRTRFARSGNPADLDEAITIWRASAEATPPDHLNRAEQLTNLAVALQSRHARTGSQADLDEAVTVGRAAADRAPRDFPERARLLSNLAVTLQSRFERNGGQVDLDEAITYGRAAVEATPPGHAETDARLSNLGVALRARFTRTGSQADLDDAVSTLRAAAEATPPDHPDRAVRLSNLAAALQSRHARTGNQADLDDLVDAIIALRAAIDATPPSYPLRFVLLANLGATLQSRHARTGNQVDLDEAIIVLRAATEATPPDHPQRATLLSNLGATLQSRHARTGNQADLDDAVTTLRAATEATPPDHPQRAALLSNLGGALHTRFERAARRADLDEAIRTLQTAVDTTPPDHPDRAGKLSNLSLALKTRFEWAGEPADLDNAITFGRAAVKGAPHDHPDQALVLSNLGEALHARFARGGHRADLDEAVSMLRAATELTAAPPLQRANAGRLWGSAAAAGGRWQEAVDGYTAAIELLGRVAPRSLGRSDQEHLLSYLNGIGPDAAACCLHAGMKDRAVELFEQGRGVLLGQGLDTRADLTRLADVRPDLAAQFTQLRDTLDTPSVVAADPTTDGSDPADPDPAATAAARRRQEAEHRTQTAEEFERLIEQIRTLDGFDRFLRPRPVGELLAAAVDGPVVLVVVGDARSDALILTSGGVLDPVSLPGLTRYAVRDRVVEFLAAVDDSTAGSGRDVERRLAGVLGWLWDNVAAPVLDRLGIDGPPSDPEAEWPRLWWCPSGLLSFLPLHAAGYHDPRAYPPGLSVIDRVVSSYTPTVRALTYAHRPRPAAAAAADSDVAGSARRVLAVAMPVTPGEKDLPGADAEAAEIEERFPGQLRVLAGPEATSGAVLAALPATRWAHFACHAEFVMSDPSKSRLLLHDHATAPLTVVDVARLHLGHADMAFLSACSTAKPGDQLADEVIHLASAFQLAGYRHVIGTLWPVADRRSVAMVEEIYGALAARQSAEHAPLALHEATRRLRGPWAAYPSVWAAHVHAGA